jgi:hypothetical protein
MEQSQVDYFSLDVEGNELDILKTIPFHLINVKVCYLLQTLKQ